MVLKFKTFEPLQGSVPNGKIISIYSVSWDANICSVTDKGDTTYSSHGIKVLLKIQYMLNRIGIFLQCFGIKLGEPYLRNLITCKLREKFQMLQANISYHQTRACLLMTFPFLSQKILIEFYVQITAIITKRGCHKAIRVQDHLKKVFSVSDTQNVNDFAYWSPFL